MPVGPKTPSLLLLLLLTAPLPSGRQLTFLPILLLWLLWLRLSHLYAVQRVGHYFCPHVVGVVVVLVKGKR